MSGGGQGIRNPESGMYSIKELTERELSLRSVRGRGRGRGDGEDEEKGWIKKWRLSGK